MDLRTYVASSKKQPFGVNRARVIKGWLRNLIRTFTWAMDYSIKRTGHFYVSYAGHVIFFTLAIEKAQKNIG
jgi:hypothetical protein